MTPGTSRCCRGQPLLAEAAQVPAQLLQRVEREPKDSEGKPPLLAVEVKLSRVVVVRWRAASRTEEFEIGAIDCPSWPGGVAATSRKYREASANGADGVVVQRS